MFDESYPSFQKDLKKLSKKYQSIPEDFERFKTALQTEKLNLPGLVRIPLGNDIKTPFYKARKFRCKTLGGGGAGGIRVVFCYHECPHPIIYFIEIYYKGDRENHGEETIRAFCQEKNLP